MLCKTVTLPHRYKCSSLSLLVSNQTITDKDHETSQRVTSLFSLNGHNGQLHIIYLLYCIIRCEALYRTINLTDRILKAAYTSQGTAYII